MRISLNWLKEYVDLEGISVSEILQQLTMSGLEVEEFIDQSEIYKNIIVGEVKEVQKHPNADKLTVCKVFDGKDELQVICGAPNVEAGQKVVFATIGSVVPNGNFQIKKAKIRGVESHGMICAEDELNLSEDHTGIMVLDKELKTGTEISTALNLNDVIIEIGITPNRPDALSHVGVARDLAAIFDRDLKYPQLKLIESDEDINSVASVFIEDSINCPRYAAKVVKGATIKESPEWLKKKLTQIGLRPINNIVDVTNFILHELGQPLHAFDMDILAEKKIVIKSTKTETTFKTLDSKERNIPADTLMICDGEREVAIAGVMGGENSEITQSTKNILIESAYFNPSSIRRTSKKLQLSSDSSYRFERGTDYNNVVFAAERAAQLMAEVSGGKICKGHIDAYPVKINQREVTLRYSTISKVLGYDVATVKIQNILSRLGFPEIKKDENSLTVSVPGFRPDVEREIDLIEEIARIHGYDNIPTISRINITLGEKHDDSEFADKVREAAISLGLNEMINNPLVSDEYSKIGAEPVALSNPLSADMANLRTSLLSGALSVTSRNINRGVKDLALFEIGSVFQKVNNNQINSFEDFIEKQNIIFVLSGKESEKTWKTEEKLFDFYSLKGLLNSFIQKISLDNVLADLYYSDVKSNYDLNFVFKYNSEVIGAGGSVKKQLLELFEIDQNVFCFEFDMDLLKRIPIKVNKFKEPLKYPKIVRDFAFIFDTSVRYGDVNDYISRNSSSLLKKVDLFDLFESESIGKEKKSMAFTLEFYDFNRTLTEEEVDKDFNDLIEKISNEFNATLRGNK